MVRATGTRQGIPIDLSANGPGRNVLRLDHRDREAVRSERSAVSDSLQLQGSCSGFTPASPALLSAVPLRTG